MLIGRGKPAGTLDWGHMSLPRVVERGGRGRQVVIFCLLTLIVGRRNDDVDRSQDLFFLGWWPPPLQSRVVGPFPGTGCVVPQLFAAGGNRSYQEFWAITSGPRYPW
jgi:hypothetical protein